MPPMSKATAVTQTTTPLLVLLTEFLPKNPPPVSRKRAGRHPHVVPILTIGEESRIRC